MKYYKYLILAIFILILAMACFTAKILLIDKIIGMADQPGLFGEILFQGNIIYNFDKGNIIKYFDTDYINYPIGEKLGFGIANSLYLLMYIPLKFFFGIIQAYNILVMVIFLFNLLSAYLLAKHLFSSRPVAFCSALVFALNSYVLLKMNMGFVQKYALFWMPLYLLALFKLQTTKKRGYAFLAGTILCLMQLTYPPYSLYMLIFTMGLGVYYLFKREQLFFAFTSFIALLFFYAIFSTWIYYLMGFGFIYGQNLKPIFKATTDGCLDLFKPFLFYPYHSAVYPVYLPLGISAVCLFCGLVAFIKNIKLSRLLILNLVFFLVMAAGPYLIHDGKLVYFFGKKIILPFYIIAKYIPLAGGVYFPIRVFPFINICLAILVGYGLSYLSSNFKRLKPLSVAAIFLISYLLENLILFPQLFPPKITTPEIPAFYEKIKNENFEAVLNFPISSDRKVINRYGYYAALSGKKMMNPYHDDDLQIYFPKAIDNKQTKEGFIGFLSDWGVGYVVVHRDFLSKEVGNTVSDEFSWLREFCELSVYPNDNLIIYKVPSHGKARLYKNVIRVPRDYSSIQQGIDAAGDDDILLVDPGKYKGCIDFKGKRITVKSKDGPKATIIDGDKKGSAVIFNSGEDNRSILEGFTICNGIGTLLPGDDPQKSLKTNGGGIICVTSSPQIINNIIENNVAENGGGICCLQGAAALIKNNIIRSNNAVKGAGIRCSVYSSPIIKANRIFSNKALKLGGGIYWRVGSYPIIKNNIIVNNTAGDKGGGLFGSSYVEKTTEQTDVMINYCIIRKNNSPVGSSIALGGSPSKIIMSYCSIEDLEESVYDPEGIVIWSEGNIDYKHSDFALQ